MNLFPALGASSTPAPLPHLGALLALNSLGHIYGGTVPASTVARRRAANKAARASRRANRRSAR